MMRRAILGAAAVLLVAAAAAALYLRSHLPDYAARVTAPGLGAPVVIERNRFAVPTIRAENLEDLYFGWGYANAQDRMFQMETTRRIGQGRISEFAGEAGLEKDLFLRALGFYELARREADTLPPEARRLLERYAAGVNHYLATEKTPLYFRLLGLEKEPWTAADPLVVGFMLNWTLAYNLGHELLYAKIARRIGPERSRELMNHIPPQTPAITDEALDRALAWAQRLGPLGGGLSASNNWAVGPAKSSNGRPILASDPHVHGSKIPSDFYLVRLQAGEFEAAGGQVAGLPFVAFGYNRHLAWGLTNQGADQVDLYVEQVDWEKKTYRRNGVERPLAAKEVEIRIKGRAPVRRSLFYAGRRPLIGEAVTGLPEALSLDWSGFDGTGFFAGFVGMNRARSAGEFTRAAAMVRMTPQNLVWADDQGNIGYRTLGTLVRRRAGTGNFPAAEGPAGPNWSGLVEAGENPAAVNPPKGFIATANNRVVRDFPVDMNPTVAPRYRYDRITELLAARERHGPEEMAAMQVDTVSRLARKLRPQIAALVRPGADPRAARALAILDRWDGAADADSPAPAIFNTWLMRFMVQTFADELGPELAAEYAGQRYISLERFLALLASGSAFFDDTATPAVETAAEIATRAFEETLALLAEATGRRDPAEWRWGAVHTIRFDHLLGNSRALRPLVNRGPYPLGGDGETNLRAHFTGVRPPFTAELAAGLRLVVSFEPEPRGRMVLITGQNETCFSPHYDDLTRLWLAGGMFSMEEEPPQTTAVISPP
jgi:penicillin amidase